MVTTYTPEEAAPIIGMAASTVRLWCKTYAVALSDGANPPPGTERRLTAQDVATLQQVKRWRDERIPSGDIVDLLQSAARQPAPLTIDAQPSSPQNDTEARSGDLLLPVALSNLQGQMDALRADFRAVERNMLWWGRVEGAIFGLVLAGFLLLLYFMVWVW